MRRKRIIEGLNNSQKFRFILTANDGAEFGMVITVQQMSDCFATSSAREAVWNALDRLTLQRDIDLVRGRPLSTGLVTDAIGFKQVQVNLH